MFALWQGGLTHMEELLLQELQKLHNKNGINYNEVVLVEFIAILKVNKKD